MTTFVIGTDNNITAFSTPEQAQDLMALGGQAFVSEKDLGKLAAEWPAARLVEIWNSFAGVAPFTDFKPVNKFENREKAVKRIWQAVQKLAPGAQDGAPGATDSRRLEQGDHPGQEGRPSAPRARSKAKAQKKPAREGSKKAEVLALMRRKNGATLPEIMKATGWQAHSVRGFISGALGKKMGLTVESTKGKDGERTYRIAE